MHRDYHSANLMLLPNDDIGVLDFQDAFIGPITYDLVSLLRDCYIDWPQEQVLKWVGQYWDKLKEQGLHINQQEFFRYFDLMGLERHLKALFTFARKQVRDQQMQYLQYIPRVIAYIRTISQRYVEFRELHDYFADIVTPAFAQKYALIKAEAFVE